jgi:hypothetical protein
MIQRLGLTFPLASDTNQAIINAFSIQNSDTQELAQHAVYILDTNGRIFYRKVAGRRPVSAELIDAIDAFRGEYPNNDQLKQRPTRKVAYPSNNFQTLIEMASVQMLPASIDKTRFQPVLNLMQAGASSDDLLIAFRDFVESSSATSSDSLLMVANWFARQRFIANAPKAVAAGNDLRRRLDRVASLELEYSTATNTTHKDELLHTLAAARGGLSKARATVTNNNSEWNLRYAQGALRGYREVVHAR